MIRFNDNFNPNPDDDLAEKLQKLLDHIEEINSIDKEAYSLLQEEVDELMQEDLNMDLAKIIDVIYNTLFLDNYNSISLTIIKNPNNSLELKIRDKL